MMRSERGMALVVTLVTLVLLSAIGVSLVLATNADVLIAANAGASSEAFYAADAALDRTIAELRDVPDLSLVLDGSIASAFADGPSSGTRTLGDGSVLALDVVVSLANCQKRTPCSESDMNANIADRPWGARNPRWRLFSHGPLRAPPGLPQPSQPVYVVSMVADDPRDDDGEAGRDGVRSGSTANPGAGIVLVRAEAYGRRGARRVVQGAVLRRDLAAYARWEARDEATRGAAPSVFPILQLLAWQEIR